MRKTALCGAAVALAAVCMGQTSPASGPGGAPTPKPDFSTPRGALVAFVRAMQSADEGTIRAAIVVAPEHRERFESLISLMAATGRIQRAVSREFGAEGEKVFGAPGPEALEARMKEVEKAEITVEGDRAEATLSMEVAPGRNKLAMRKGADGWKADLSDFFAAGADAKQVSAEIARTRRLVVVTDQAARDVAAKKYPSAQEAFNAYWNQMRLAVQEVQAATAPATATRPAATRPAGGEGEGAR